MDTKQQFEVTVERQLQAAFDAAGGAPEVTAIWIYMAFGPGSVGLSETLYSGGGRTVEAFRLDSLLSTPVGSGRMAWQDRLVHEVNDAFEDLIAAYAAHPDQARPERIIVRYDPATERMDADFSYRKPDATTLDPVPIFEAWLEHANATGDHSADALTRPED